MVSGKCQQFEFENWRHFRVLDGPFPSRFIALHAYCNYQRIYVFPWLVKLILNHVHKSIYIKWSNRLLSGLPHVLHHVPTVIEESRNAYSQPLCVLYTINWTCDAHKSKLLQPLWLAFTSLIKNNFAVPEVSIAGWHLSFFITNVVRSRRL